MTPGRADNISVGGDRTAIEVVGHYPSDFSGHVLRICLRGVRDDFVMYGQQQVVAL